MTRGVLPSRAELEAREGRTWVGALGTSPIAEVSVREHVRVAGTVVALTYPPREAHAALIVRIHDGTGAISLLYMGRRDIAGISPGRRMIAEGVVAERDGQSVIYSPRYELLAGAGE